MHPMCPSLFTVQLDTSMGILGAWGFWLSLFRDDSVCWINRQRSKSSLLFWISFWVIVDKAYQVAQW